MLKPFSPVRDIRATFEALRLPEAARRQCFSDMKGLPEADPGPERALNEALAWLCRAQDNNASHDEGFARDYSLIKGWAPSYPETSGYIIPTLIEHGERNGDEALMDRARRGLDWLVSIQFEDGGFPGGVMGAKPWVPVTFNTGQILLGLAAGQQAFRTYDAPMRKAADWLVATQDDDGCWRKHPTPFAKPGEKVYETHVAWGLLEAARIAPEMPYGKAGLRNVDWALTHQKKNGWFANCCLTDAAAPLTHTIGYVLRGVVEAYRFSNEERYLNAAMKTANGALSALRHDDGYLPGQLAHDWTPAASWACLTGSVQIAHCWLMLAGYTGDKHYQKAANKVLSYLRRTMSMDGPDETRGAVRGSFPVYGDYGHYEYLNWAAKFFIDCQTLALDMVSDPERS